MEVLCYYFLLYFMYCVIGYVLECIFCSIIDKKLVLNRGFLIGPYLPIYGKGALCIILLLNKYLEDPFALFIMASLIATVLEYFASYFMEKIFKARWWDYSEKKFNLNGRVCLTNTVLFGLGGLIVMYVVNPFLTGILDGFSKTTIIVLGLIFFTIYAVDTIISFTTIYKLRSSSTSLKKDSTEEISEQVRETILKNSYFKKRLLNAFPRVETSEMYNKIKDILNKK